MSGSVAGNFPSSSHYCASELDDMISDSYITIAKFSRAEFKIKGSRFIASALPVRTRTEAEDFVEKIRREFRDATHNCFAYIVGYPKKETRTGDDGEPSGTGGQKILAAIESRGLSNVAVVVTRYFGGTKLGIGGLSRAYRDATLAVLDAGGVAEQHLMERLLLTFPYERVGTVMRLVEQWHALIEEAAYAEDVTLTISIRKSAADAFYHSIIDATAGNISVRLMP